MVALVYPRAECDIGRCRIYHNHVEEANNGHCGINRNFCLEEFAVAHRRLCHIFNLTVAKEANNEEKRAWEGFNAELETDEKRKVSVGTIEALSEVKLRFHLFSQHHFN